MDFYYRRRDPQKIKNVLRFKSRGEWKKDYCIRENRGCKTGDWAKE